MGDVSKVRWPFGLPDDATLTATGDQDITIENDKTIIDGVTNAASGERTLNLTIDESVNKGAIIVLKTKTAATQDTVFGTGVTGATYAGVAGKTKVTTLEYDGTAFLNVSTPVQID